MERRSNIQQHPHQESRKGYALYASHTRMKSTPNESKDFQTFVMHGPSAKTHHKNPVRYFLPFRDDEDSDERSIYFGKQQKKTADRRN
jgi:hypothetical protein